MHELPFLLADYGTEDPRVSVVAIVDAITAMPECAALGATMHRLNLTKGKKGYIWLLQLRVPDAVNNHYKGDALMLRVEDAVTESMGRQITVIELPFSSDVDTITRSALDVYSSADGWVVRDPTLN